jgi:hypothetical protein
MPRPRVYFKWGIPKTVVVVVIAICADYDRRTKAMQFKTVPSEVAVRYAELNGAIDHALAEVEPGMRSLLLADLQQGKGYDKSMASPIVGKNGYYNRKRKVIHDIAVGLNLI